MMRHHMDPAIALENSLAFNGDDSRKDRPPALAVQARTTAGGRSERVPQGSNITEDA